MKSQLIFLFTALLGLVAAGKHDIYARNSVHGIKLRDRSEHQLLGDLISTLDVDIWQYGEPEVRDALVMLTPANRETFLAAMDDKGVEHYVKMANVTKALEEEEKRLLKSSRQSDQELIFQKYPRYAEIDEYLESIAAQYPDIVTLVNVGKSFEGRDIKYLKISTTNFMDTSKPIYFMDASMHAREWVTTPVTLYSIYRLVENLRTEDNDLLTDIDWIILPLVNPDGYEYTHTHERLWRKTRSINPTTDTCIGVDANRNFDVAFNTVGVSSNPCAMTYPGWEPFSEVETRYVRDILFEHLDRIQIYMNIHSHGNWLLFAYGDQTLPPNAAQIHQVAAATGAAIDAVKLPQAGFYRVGNSAMLLYGSSGSAQDYGQLVGVPFSYTLELPGYGYGFLVPEDYIDQINTETWLGIAVSARLSRAYYWARINANA
ncbi:unnamed protein product [Arctia plantaginis]|uniref:Peptidase M14 domain-containing protein n=1 Tax=Arctia plantaginis TaxID=874455 RepID=A0A8S0YN23_ARCPL|nr:unnamed protein product [Arctia plantaginis]